jgi:hypothetical protein
MMISASNRQESPHVGIVRIKRCTLMETLTERLIMICNIQRKRKRLKILSKVQSYLLRMEIAVSRKFVDQLQKLRQYLQKRKTHGQKATELWNFTNPAKKIQYPALNQNS